MSDSHSSHSGHRGRRSSQARRSRGSSGTPSHEHHQGKTKRHQSGTQGQGKHTSQPKRRTRRPLSEHAPAFHPFTPEQLAARAAAIPVVTFPDLPVTERREDIAAAIRDHQVVIVAGETGSGKTTQLPKILLQLGRGVQGMIGHTQPRRLAAHAVATRIAEELGQTVSREPGHVVGYQVRFTDHVGPTTLIKLMTDGILLAEIQSDPMLRRYDTLIIDEAHERSLNIDFILGYLARLLPVRPDLKVIITSATIDSTRFAQHFGRWEDPSGHHVPPGQGRLIEAAPVIEVSGRTYPVEVRYRPLSADLPTQWSSTSADPSTSANPSAPAAPSSPTAPPAPAAGHSPADAPHGATEEARSAHFQQLVLEDPDDDLPTLGYGLGEDIDQEAAICAAVDELCAEGPGDILVFLPGERDIRDVQQALVDHLGQRAITQGATRKTVLPGSVEILPLYARLTAAEQQRIFQPHSLRRVVLATNVAETSLTVPGIRYVIDPGLARISRYSNRTKVQRLPIEPISQASANQRAGRSGRLEDGIAIRLYSQRDYENRPAFTEPEILRTSLASVILQMAALGLGAVEDFPFIDPPDSRAVRDGVQLLVEIGALEYEAPAGQASADAGPHASGTKGRRGASSTRLTSIGRDLARLPIDPRLGRILLEADANGAASDVLIIVAALSLQDVRERPIEHQGAADEAHARFTDPHSDFITYLNLWRYLTVQQRDLSGSAFRRMCRSEFLHYLRWREWRDIVGQLTQLARPLDLAIHPIGEPSPADIARSAQTGGILNAAARAVVAYTASHRTVDADQIHRSLLVGLLSNLGSWEETKRDYQGARGTHFTIWPGSGLARSHPAWVMTAELVETSRLFARTVARIEPEWIEPVAKNLVKRVYSEPYWSASKGAAMVKEKVLLYGLTITADRPVLLGRVDMSFSEGMPDHPVSAHSGGLSGIAQALRGATPRAVTAQELAREMFIRHALVRGEWREVHRFQKTNDELLEQAREVERRSRTHGVVADEDALYAFFDEIIPQRVISARHFAQWWKNERRDHPDLLTYPMEVLLPRGTGGDHEGFPDTWLIEGGIGRPAREAGSLPPDAERIELPLSYQFSPGSQRDGVTLTLPVELLERVTDRGTDWLVPGLRDELLTEFIRALPKAKRRLLAPAPEVAGAVARWIDEGCPAARNEATAAASGPSAKVASAGVPELDPMSLEAAMGRLAAWGAKTGNARRSASSSTAPAHPAAEAATSTPQTTTPDTTTPPAGASASPDAPQTGGSSAQTGDAMRSAHAVSDRSVAQVMTDAVRVLRGVDLSAEDCAHAMDGLPAHLRMTFVVVDRQGRELGASKSLAHVQRTLATQADSAIRQAVRGAVAQALDEARRDPRRRPGTTVRNQHSPTVTNAHSEAHPLADLQVSPDRQVTAEGATAASSPLHCDGLTAFPEVAIPRTVDSVGAGGTRLRGYPCLVPQGDAANPQAGVRVMANPSQADRQHRSGVACLLLARVQLSTARVTTRWTGRQAAMLAASPYPATAALVADAQMASALALVDELSPSEDPSSVRDVAAFEAVARRARDLHEDRVYDILGHVIRALEAYAEAQGAVLEYREVASMKEAVADARRQMASLVYPGFISDTPAFAMPHLARYLQAIAVRLTKAAGGGLNRDMENMQIVRELEDAVDEAREAAESLPFNAQRDHQIRAARWMIEELRVSVFAQTLGTPQKVSAKRIRALLAL